MLQYPCPTRAPDSDAGAQGEQGLQELHQRRGQNDPQIQFQPGELLPGLRIRSIFGRLRIMQIIISKSDPGSYWHLKNQFKHLNFFHIKRISSDI